MPLSVSGPNHASEVELEHRSLLHMRTEQSRIEPSYAAATHKRGYVPLFTESESKEPPSSHNDSSSAVGTFLAKMRDVGTALRIGFTCTILLINVLFTIIATAKFHAPSGIGTFYRGSCVTVSNWSTALHILINVFSSLLLAASNYVMQVLCAPTRQELDRAHAKGDWLDIGILSVRNLCGRVSASKTCLCIILGLSSLPIHLLYNSAIFRSTTSNAFAVGLVQPDFATNTSARAFISSTQDYMLNPNSPNWRDYPYPAGNQTELSRNISALFLAPILETFYNTGTGNSGVETLNNSECIAAYGVNMVTKRSDVLLVSTCTGAYPKTAPTYQGILGGPLFFNFIMTQWAPNSVTFAWMCQIPGESGYSDGEDVWDELWNEGGGCDIPELRKTAEDWIVNGCKVEYCLSRPEEAQCELQFSTSILLIVILCNAAKATIIIWTLVYRGNSLTTVGDTVASYLNDPDPLSAGNCTATKKSIRHKQLPTTSSSSYTTSEFHQARYRISAVSPGRWCTTLGLCLLTIIAASILLHIGLLSRYTLGNLFKLPFGQLNSGEIVDLPILGSSLVDNVLTANLPQAIVSFLYVSYNGILTEMLLASEWNQYYLRPKPLRVTTPKGHQRSTHWLQLPFTYSVPLLLATMVLHWLISESLFAAQVESNDSRSLQEAHQILGQDYSPTTTSSVLGYSCLPILLSIVLGSFMVIALVVVGCRRLVNPMPLVASCSLAIAAACHPPSDDKDAADLPVSWGAIESEANNIGHCCFTSKPVHPLVPGKQYAGQLSEVIRRTGAQDNSTVGKGRTLS